jgi:hypothetical protein
MSRAQIWVGRTPGSYVLMPETISRHVESRKAAGLTRVLPTARCAQVENWSVRRHTLRAQGRHREVVVSPPALLRNEFAAGLLALISDAGIFKVASRALRELAGQWISAVPEARIDD